MSNRRQCRETFTLWMIVRTVMKCALISRRFCTVSVDGPGSTDTRACVYVISTPNVYQYRVPRQKWGNFQGTCYVYPRYQRSFDRRRLDIYPTFSRRIYQRLSENLYNLIWISSLRVMRKLILGWHGQNSLIWRNVSVLPTERWASPS